MLPSLYQPGASWLHRRHPLTKLVFSLASLAVIFGGPPGWPSAAGPGLLALLLLGRAGLARRALAALGRWLMPWAAALFVVHGLFYPANRTSLLAFGPLVVGREGLIYAGMIALRLAAALAASQVLVLTTPPAHLVQALAQAGWPRGLAYLLGSPLLLLPELAGRAQAIQAAQQARGLETGGSLWRRMRALLPLAAPLIFSALVEVEQRALALEARGFSAPGPRTSLVEWSDPLGERLGRIGLAVVAAVCVAARWWR